ncbi:DUF833-domain-containing protein [Basidiobolus meristosporus CBS 931.73]|uniref:DUF833-domain-containing protein n=1 Tax=Basidiobolus meristosporus CBS 931.73 TaxID=1314790 RepID=A0A1Y1Z0G4_9FUNG|nr:DUF833-domain-containing protein [Basidiobolus meristosporus CBS 931.73]|eukprot:ORY03614.1 DUF833-domain-containing protein [Basidiobolus meristosporus CBS 931.73]
MCINFWTLQHPKYRFVFASNRDEFLARATKRAEFWPPAESALSGIDTTHITANEPIGGTWLGVNKKGRFVSLTNFREPVSPGASAKISRGFLVRDLLLSENSLREDFDKVKQTEADYDGFNLVAFDFKSKDEEAYYYSNRGESELRQLNRGEIYGLSNSVLSVEWPKVRKGKPIFEETLSKELSEEALIEELLCMLRDTSPFQDSSELTKLEDLAQCICIPKIGILGKGANAYATRTSTIVLLSHDNELVFVEREWYNAQHEPYEDPSQQDRVYRFTIPS